MIGIIRKIFTSIVSIKSFITIKEVKNKVSLIGEGHNFDKNARVYLSWGSTKDDIILNDHAEIFGSIHSCAHGKVVFGKWAKLGNSKISCVNSIEIGDDAAIADYVIIVDHNYHPTNPEDRRYMRHTSHSAIERAPMFSDNAPIKIGKNVMLGNYVRVCKGVTIGDNTIIGANSVVTKDIPANCIAVGNPAKVVKENIDKNTIPVFPIK